MGTTKAAGLNFVAQAVGGATLVFAGMLVRPWIWPVEHVAKNDVVVTAVPDTPSSEPKPSPTSQQPASVIAAKVGEDIDFKPLSTEAAPARVHSLDIVRQTLKPGQTHETLLKGSIESIGTDRFWGIESTVSIYYLFEAQIDRDIIDNDGDVVVEHRHFRNVRSIKIDTTLKDLRINLGPAKTPLITGLAFIWPDAALAVSQFDGLSIKPVVTVLSAIGIDPLKVTGAKQAIVKMFTQFDSLTGKSVKQVYWNKEGRTGVVRVTALVGDITEQESFVHNNSAVLSDILIFPERTKKIGESWKVLGNAFSNLIDPGLRASVGGEIQMIRGADRTLNGQNVAILIASEGRLTLQSDDLTANRVGWFEPRGELLFSSKDEVISEAELSGKGLLEKVSRTHLLFRTEMKQEPVVKVSYFCRVKQTVASGER